MSVKKWVLSGIGLAVFVWYMLDLRKNLKKDRKEGLIEKGMRTVDEGLMLKTKELEDQINQIDVTGCSEHTKKMKELAQEMYGYHEKIMDGLDKAKNAKTRKEQMDYWNETSLYHDQMVKTINQMLEELHKSKENENEISEKEA